MSRNLVYVNGQNESVTFETGPYLIVKIEGLGIPNVDRQEQKAPYQDGTTYIDSLLQNRDIVVELAITKPNDFTNIALYRRQLSQRLCPKYGLGTLTYTDEDGNAYNIRAVVSSMVFPNKDYRDPYMRAMVTFTANDPYWKDVTEDSISLPTVENSSPVTVVASDVQYISIIQLPDETFYAIYELNSDYRMYGKASADGMTWGTQINIETSEYVNGARAVVLNNGNILAYYQIQASPYTTYGKISTDNGATWGSRFVLESRQVNYVNIIIEASGNLRFTGLLYSTSQVIQKVSANNGTSWGSDIVISTGVPIVSSSCVQRADGSFVLAYTKTTGRHTFARTSADGFTWSSETEIIFTDSGYLSMVLVQSGAIELYYFISTGSIGIWRISLTNGGWQNPSMLYASFSQGSVIVCADSSLLIAYKDSYFKCAFRSVTPVPAVITGDVPAPFVVTFNGPSVNPRIINQNTLEYIRLNTTLAAGDSFVVDTSFGNKTVILTQGGIVRNGIAFLDIGSTFFQLERGTNTVYYEDDAVLSTATATMEWTERYVGL